MDATDGARRRPRRRGRRLPGPRPRPATSTRRWCWTTWSRSVRTTGGIGVVGVYVPEDPGASDEGAKEGRIGFDYGTFFTKGQHMGTGQAPVKRYNRQLRDLIIAGRATPVASRLPRAAPRPRRRRRLRALRQARGRLDQGPAASGEPLSVRLGYQRLSTRAGLDRSPAWHSTAMPRGRAAIQLGVNVRGPDDGRRMRRGSPGSRRCRSAGNGRRESNRLLCGASDLLSSASEMMRGETCCRAEPAPASEALSQLVSVATSQVTGCSGASATLWRGGEAGVLCREPPRSGGAGRDRATLRTRSVATALAAGDPVWSPDTLEENRWPEYAAAALACGVRCSATLVHQSGPLVVTSGCSGRAGRAGNSDAGRYR